MDYDTALPADVELFLTEYQQEPEPIEDAQNAELQALEVLERPFLTTSFEDYSVTEGLLLLIVLILVIRVFANIIKGGFSWLR